MRKRLIGFMLEEGVVDVLDAICGISYGCPRSALLRKAVELIIQEARRVLSAEEWSRVQTIIRRVQDERGAAERALGRQIEGRAGAVVIPLRRRVFDAEN